VLVEGNVIENCWKAGQNGFAIQLTPRNQEGKAPWSVVEDVTIRRASAPSADRDGVHQRRRAVPASTTLNHLICDS